MTEILVLGTFHFLESSMDVFSEAAQAELDSLAFVEFVIELENRFDIRIEETYLVKANFSPLDFVCTHIENLLQEKERQGEDA